MVFANDQLNQTSIHSTSKVMNNTIYDYFTNLYCTINSTKHTNTFCSTYKHLTAKLLKRKLKQLKMKDALFQEIRYVTHQLRSQLKNQDLAHTSATTVNQDGYLSKNSWGFVKRMIEKGSTVHPTFSQTNCTLFFIKMFTAALPC